MSNDIATRATVEEMVACYDRTVAALRAGYELIDGALCDFGAAFQNGGGRYSVGSSRRSSDVTFEDPGPAIVEIRRSAWRAVVERLKVRRMMSIKKWKELSEKLDRDEPPVFTVELVMGLAKQVASDGPEMIRESVVEVFDFLRPPQSRFKTNTEFALGKRVILSGTVESYWCSKWHVRDWCQQRLIALENVFALCDGKPGAEIAGYYSAMASAIQEIPRDKPCVGETCYFKFKGHKNGTLHIEFKRPDLVRKLNAIAGGNRLVPVGQDAA